MKNMGKENRYGTFFIVGVAMTIITILSLITTVLVLRGKRKKKEDQQLEEYLEGSIQ